MTVCCEHPDLGCCACDGQPCDRMLDDPYRIEEHRHERSIIDALTTPATTDTPGGPT